MLSPGCRDDAVAAATPAAYDGVCLLADKDVTSNNVGVDTNLVLAVEASKSYMVRARLMTGRISGTAGTRIGITGPAGAAIEGYLLTSGNGLTNIIAHRVSLFQLDPSLVMNTNPAQVDFWARIQIGVTAGDIRLQLSGVNGTDVIRMYAGSAMEIEEITEV